MELYSTNDKKLRVSLKEAALKGMPADGGLFMPLSIPRFSDAEMNGLLELDFPELACRIAKKLLPDEFEDAEWAALTSAAFDFDAPIVRLSDDLHVLELFHGPSLAFKDFGARFMAQLLSRYVNKAEGLLNILVATSGDTGGAVANGFFGAEGIQVIILYPSGKVSGLQEKQLTTLGHNILALEVNGSFDDCQAMVKQAFLDKELNASLRLASANSINIARLIPQSFYYFRAWQQLADKEKPLVFSVPSGNFGNLTAGMLAMRMGLPVYRFIAATNRNDVVPEYLRTGKYRPRPSVPTVSNAMDVGNPSNFARMLDLSGGDPVALRADVAGFSFSDPQTKHAITEIMNAYGYLMDPHGAVGYLALEAYRQVDPGIQGIILETAHPSKFPDLVEDATGEAVKIPERLARLADLPKVSVEMPANYGAFKDWIQKQLL
jgi:threonine synthase